MSISYGGISLPVTTPPLEGWAQWATAFADWRPWQKTAWYWSDLSHLPLPSLDADDPDPQLGRLVWPVGASRFAYALYPVDRAAVASVRAAVGTGGTALPLALADGRGAPFGVTAPMYMLPARPLAGTGDLWALVLVDERYWWWNKPVSVTEQPASWATLFDTISGALGVSLAGDTAIEAAYQTPTDRWLAVREAPAGVVLDAAAACVGRRVVRRYDGTVRLERWDTAKARSDADYTTFTTSPYTDLRAGGRLASEDIARAVPAVLDVCFGKQDESTLAQQAGFYTVARPVSGQPGVSGYYAPYNGHPGAVGRFTADFNALMPSGGGDPTNLAQLTALATQAADDWYGMRLADVDASFHGLVSGFDTAWSWRLEVDYLTRDAVTRVAREPHFNPSVYGHYPVSVTGGSVTGGSVTGPGFWARLTGKTYGGTFIAYSWTRVKDRPEDGDPESFVLEGWTETVAHGELPDNWPAYEVNNHDLVVSMEPTTADDPGDDPLAARGEQLDDLLTVVWLRPAANGKYYLFEHVPWWELVRLTGAPDEFGLYPATTIRWNQNTDAAEVIEGVKAYDFNSGIPPLP